MKSAARPLCQRSAHYLQLALPARIWPNRKLMRHFVLGMQHLNNNNKPTNNNFNTKARQKFRALQENNKMGFSFFFFSRFQAPVTLFHDVRLGIIELRSLFKSRCLSLFELNWLGFSIFMDMNLRHESEKWLHWKIVNVVHIVVTSTPLSCVEKTKVVWLDTNDCL